ncbi:EpsG family protein [Ileibacterium valens]|uniref:EpsG family protein n=1 Tax=Ileibacterium valens TaxID=1862668 RepID=UPI0024BA5FFF|nr:EpsG family protein [Ileibacterium valens]
MILIAYLLIIFILLFKTEWLLQINKKLEHLLDHAEPSQSVLFLKRINSEMIWEYVIIAFITLICFRAASVPDFANYAAAYNKMSLGIPYSYLGKGWYILMNIGFTFGFSYSLVKAIIAFGALLLVNSSVNFFCKSFKGRMFFWGIMLIFPILLDITQIRFFAGSALVIFGLRYLKSFSFKNITCYLGLVLIGTLVHSSILFYSLFILVYLYPFGQRIFTVCFLSISLIGMMFKDYLIGIASCFIQGDRLERYFTSGESIGTIGLFVVCTIVFSQLIILIWLQKYKKQINRSKQGLSNINLAYGICVISLIILPLCKLDSNFFRLERIGWLIFVMVCTSYLFNRNSLVNHNGKKCLKWGVITLAICENLYLITLFTFQIIAGYLL